MFPSSSVLRSSLARWPQWRQDDGRENAGGATQRRSGASLPQAPGTCGIWPGVCSHGSLAWWTSGFCLWLLPQVSVHCTGWSNPLGLGPWKDSGFIQDEPKFESDNILSIRYGSWIEFQVWTTFRQGDAYRLFFTALNLSSLAASLTIRLNTELQIYTDFYIGVRKVHSVTFHEPVYTSKLLTQFWIIPILSWRDGLNICKLINAFLCVL